MKFNLADRPSVATDVDYANGRHYGWEVAAHEAEEEFFKKTDKRWSYEQRKHWLERYFVLTSYDNQWVVRDCAPCQEEISKAMLENRKPFACPVDIRAQLNALTRKLCSVAVRKKLSRTLG